MESLDRSERWPIHITNHYVLTLGTPSKKNNYLDRDIVPISSDPPTYETDRDNLDRDKW